MNPENNQHNTTTQPQGYYPQPQYQDDEIDLRELFSIIWKGKWFIIAITFVFMLGSVGVALWLPNEYKATAVVQSNQSGSAGKLASLAGQFGGLASLAGINLDVGESSDAIIAMEILKSWSFSEQFINKHNLAVPLFAAKGWTQSSNEVVIDKDLYDLEAGAWVREPPKGKTVEPTSWELYEEYKDRISISKNEETGLVSISVTHFSPYLAKRWTSLLVKEINNYMKTRTLEEANKNIEYLEEQISTTSFAEIRTVFSELIQEQHKNKMLAQVSDEYVFKTISQAKVPEEKDKPNRILIIVLGVLLGLMLSLTITISRYIFRD